MRVENLEEPEKRVVDVERLERLSKPAKKEYFKV